LGQEAFGKATQCNPVQSIATHCNVLVDREAFGVLYIVWSVAACCSVLQHVAACCSVSQRVAARCSVLQRVAIG